MPRGQASPHGTSRSHDLGADRPSWEDQLGSLLLCGPPPLLCNDLQDGHIRWPSQPLDAPVWGNEMWCHLDHSPGIKEIILEMPCLQTRLFFSCISRRVAIYLYVYFIITINSKNGRCLAFIFKRSQRAETRVELGLSAQKVESNLSRINENSDSLLNAYC